LLTFLLGLALNLDLPDRCLLSSWDYRHVLPHLWPDVIYLELIFYIEKNSASTQRHFTNENAIIVN
jgi:hypothetical protein